MGSYKKIGLSHEMGLIDTPSLTPYGRTDGQHGTATVKNTYLAKKEFDGFCLACEAEARHMYCFSGGVVVVVVIRGGGVNFFVFRSFSRKL